MQVGDQAYQGYPEYTPGRAVLLRRRTAAIPGGWYSFPFWETVLLGSVLSGGFGGGWGGGGYDAGYDRGYEAGRDAAQDSGGGLGRRRRLGRLAAAVAATGAAAAAATGAAAAAATPAEAAGSGARRSPGPSSSASRGCRAGCSRRRRPGWARSPTARAATGSPTWTGRPPPKGPPWAHNSLGAAVHNALRDWWLLPLAAAHAGGRRARCSTRAWITDGFADGAQSRDLAGPAPATGSRAYVADARPGRRAGRRGAHGRGRAPTGWRCPAGSTGSTRRGRRAGHRRLQDRPVRCRTPTTRAARWRWRCTRWPPGGRCAGRAAGSSCTTCRPAGSRLRAHRGVAGPARAPGRGHRRRHRSPRPTRWPAAPTRTRSFPPRPGRQCGWCDFRRHCPAGRAAAPGAGTVGRAGREPATVPPDTDPGCRRAERIGPWRSPRRSSSSGTTTAACSR